MEWASALLPRNSNNTTAWIQHSVMSIGQDWRKSRRVQKWPSHVRIGHVVSNKGRWKCVTLSALPDAASAVISVMIMGAAATVFAKQNKSTSEESKQKLCEACNGSGICPECNGEGFILKNPSKEAAARARLNADDAATRYTAGLAKKWNYCSICSGSRGCLVCEGRGQIK